MDPHAWDVSPKEAIAIQKELREKVRLTPLSRPPEVIAGVDVSLNLYSTTVFAGCVVLSYPDLAVLETSVAREEVTFPYVPGLLSFREIPALLEAWGQLRSTPDLIFVDGVGIAHPRRLGIATHLGLVLDIPTIGCAKSVLVGVYEEPALEAGSCAYLRDPKANYEHIGAALRTKRGVTPMFISPGHKITLEEAVGLTLSVTRKHRLPEPTRLAHTLTNERRRRFDASA